MRNTCMMLGLSVLLTACSSSRFSLNDALKVLQGQWALQSLTGQNDLGTLFANKRPALRFDTQAMRVSGNNGCNNISGPLRIEAGNKISFGQLAGTRMACPGQGEQVFTSALNKVTHFRLDQDVLQLLSNEDEIMRFAKSTE